MVKTLNNLFVQDILKEIILSKEEQFITVLSYGRDVFEEFMNNLWKVNVDLNPESQVPEGDNIIEVNSFEFKDENFIVYMTIPNDLNSGDTIYTAFNFNFDDYDMRFFTYELLNGEFYICEWKLDDEHKFYSKTSDINHEVFVNEVLKIL